MGAAPVRVVVLEVDITTRTRMVAAGVTVTAPGTATVEEGTGEVSEVVEEGSAAEIETGTEAGMEDTKKGEKTKERYTKIAFDVCYERRSYRKKKVLNRHVPEWARG